MGKFDNKYKHKNSNVNNYKPKGVKKTGSWNKDSSINAQKFSQTERREFGIKTSYKKLLRKEEKKEIGKKLVEISQAPNRELPEQPLATTSNWIVTVSSTEGQDQNKVKGKKSKPSALKKAQNEYQKKKDEERDKQEETKRKREERDLAITSRKKKRLEKYKVLNQRTPKGQPLMKGRMQLLLDKIQSDLS